MSPPTSQFGSPPRGRRDPIRHYRRKTSVNGGLDRLFAAIRRGGARGIRTPTVVSEFFIPSSSPPRYTSPTLLLSQFTPHRCIIRLRPRMARIRAVLRVPGLTTRLRRACTCPARQPLALRTCLRRLPHPTTTMPVVQEPNQRHHSWGRYPSHRLNPVLRAITLVCDRSFTQRRVVYASADARQAV